jgi:hypothetical protein
MSYGFEGWLGQHGLTLGDYHNIGKASPSEGGARAGWSLSPLSPHPDHFAGWVTKFCPPSHDTAGASAGPLPEDLMLKTDFQGDPGKPPARPVRSTVRSVDDWDGYNSD